MNRLARAAGILFLVSTGAYMIGSGILNPILQRPGFLEGIYSDRTNVTAGMLLELINAFAVAGIGMLLYPFLKQHNEAFALGYFGSRIIESAILIISLVSPVILVVLSKDYSAAGASSHSYFHTLADIVVEGHFMLFELAMVVLGLGSLLLCYILYQSKLVPRWLSVTGFIGYAGLLTSSCLALAGYDTGAVLYIPGAVFEILLPVWLIAKGLSTRAEKA